MGTGCLVVQAHLCACTTPDPQADQAALLVAPDRATYADLSEVMEQAVGVPVMLADDTLVHSSQLIIERKQHRHLEQGVVMGTDLSGPPERFTLVRNGEQCLLIKASDNSRWPLKKSVCVAE